MESVRRSGASVERVPDLPSRYASPRFLARGGMGAVWCAEDTALDRRVAIKLLGEAYIDDEHAKRRFLREARTAARLSGHPHVVTTYDVGDLDGLPYIVMEHLAGGTVADAIRLGAVSRPQALRWIEEAASALDHAHGLGVLHRDVKPANMLLGSDRVLRLADFGIASLSTEQTLSRTGQLMGTAAYLSPEQALGRPATAASDRYALAVAAFELLTGERPYPAESFAAQARAHIEDPPPRASVPAGLPDAVDAVMARGLAKEPAERWPTAESFARALREAVGERAPRLAGLGAASAEAFIGARHRARAARGRAAAAAPSFHARAAASVPPFGVRGGSVASPALREPPPQVIFESIASAGIGRRHGRGLALAALALVALACGVVVGSSGSGPGASRTAGSALRAGRVTSAATPRPAARPRRPATPRPAAHGVSRPATQPAPPTTTTPAAAPPSDAATLEAQGHQLMTGGSYSAALPVLRQAVANAEPGTLTYAYALYDLGRTLRLAGDPQAAIPVLEARLRIPNQPAVVAQELNLAERAAGAPAARPLPPSGGAGLPGGHGQGPGAGPDTGARPSDGPGAGRGPGVRRHSSADLSRSI